MFKLRDHQSLAIDTMERHQKGQLIMPTGAGKTICFIKDTERLINSNVTNTIVVVCPRILLAQQLCEEFLEVIDTRMSHILHVHSGTTHHYSTTNPENIFLFNNVARDSGENVIIFTTYHSLHQVMESDIEVNTIYFDESHNSTSKGFNIPVSYFSQEADRAFFFTATRKTSVADGKIGMNDYECYGNIISRVPAPELIEKGYILPPKLKLQEFDFVSKINESLENDRHNILKTVKDSNIDKLLVCVKSVKQLTQLMSLTSFANDIKNLGYDFLYITAKTGAIVNGEKVSREDFFTTLNSWGRDSNKKFVCLHRSILSEGINVSGLQGVIILRNMTTIDALQTIGRVIRLGDSTKTHGVVIVPTYNKVTKSVAKGLQTVIDKTFIKGELVDSVTRR